MANAVNDRDAFNRDIDPRHFHPEAAGLAWRRTLDFLKATLS